VNAFKLIKNVSVAALLASICAPFAVGCAAPVEGDDAAPVAVSTQALTEQKLGLTPADAIEKMAIALAEAAAGKVAHQLFPEPGIDLEKLLSDIDANTRRAILDEALRQDKGAIYAAMEELNDVESNKSHIGEAGRKTAATLYNEAHDLPSLASLNQVRAKLGPDASSDVYKRDGIKLYATAVQIDAGRLMLLSSLDAAQAVSNREELVRHLKVAVAHVRATAKAGRQAEFDARLGLIVPVISTTRPGRARRWTTTRSMSTTPPAPSGAATTPTTTPLPWGAAMQTAMVTTAASKLPWPPTWTPSTAQHSPWPINGSLPSTPSRAKTSAAPT
jgi:hypothetical protein